MKAFGVIGWSGSGKTTLIAALIPALRAKGLSVSTVKNTHHDIDMDKPGKDSYRHRHAGAAETLLTGPKRWTLIHEYDNAPGGRAEPPLDELLHHMSYVDLVIVEGFKTDSLPKIEVNRPSLGKPLLAADRPGVVAVAADGAVDGWDGPRLDLNDVDAIATFIVATLGLKET